tara:strand:- start:726 stop:944 length:219 start_codon:yes stop_codon:yes gene_type:complete
MTKRQVFYTAFAALLVLTNALFYLQAFKTLSFYSVFYAFLSALIAVLFFFVFFTIQRRKKLTPEKRVLNQKD